MLLINMKWFSPIELDKKAANAIQDRYSLTNYQMLCLSWFIGIATGALITFLLKLIYNNLL
tara:strand:- start:1503 stop:1685 length:183 start_codon:yes stop_codon:yes gene_type:complete